VARRGHRCTPEVPKSGAHDGSSIFSTRVPTSTHTNGHGSIIDGLVRRWVGLQRKEGIAMAEKGGMHILLLLDFRGLR
jgi:hypothetical protein